MKMLMFRRFKIWWLLVCLLSLQPALAVQPPTPPTIAVLGGNTSLSVSAVTANVVLPAVLTGFPAVQVRNTGLNTVYVASGTSGVTATTSSIPVLPGDSLPLWVSNTANTYVAGITASGPSTLVIYQWNGFPAVQFGGGGTNGQIAALPITTFQAQMTLSGATSTTLTTGNVTINAAGAALPPTFQRLTIINTGTNLAYVCWFGGTCSTTAGEALPGGASDTVNLNGFTTPPTLFSTLGTTLSFRN